LRDRDKEITAMLTAANRRSPLDVLLGAESVEQMWHDVLTLGQQRAILAEVLTVTVQPTTGGGRAPDGSYFNAASVDIAVSATTAAELATATRVRPPSPSSPRRAGMPTRQTWSA
jgi:hypothetical protein